MVTFAATERDVGAATGGGLGKGDAHPPARAVADEAHGVDRLAGAAGGDQDAQAVPRPGGPGSSASTLRRSSGGCGSRPAPCSPRGRRAAPRRARSRSRRARAAGSRFRWVAPSRYIRSFIAGATSRGAVHARNDVVDHRVGDPGRELRDRVGRRGRDQVGVGVLDQGRGARSGRVSGCGSPGKRPRIGSRSHSSIRTGAPTIPSNDAAPTKRVADGVIRTHAVARLRREPRKLERTVGGDPTRDAEQDASHGAGPLSATPCTRT